MVPPPCNHTLTGLRSLSCRLQLRPPTARLNPTLSTRDRIPDQDTRTASNYQKRPLSRTDVIAPKTSPGAMIKHHGNPVSVLSADLLYDKAHIFVFSATSQPSPNPDNQRASPCITMKIRTNTGCTGRVLGAASEHGVRANICGQTHIKARVQIDGDWHIEPVRLWESGQRHRRGLICCHYRGEKVTVELIRVKPARIRQPSF